MNIVETILIYALIPLAIYAVVSVLTLRSKFAGNARYRPGQPWKHEPMWWSANPGGLKESEERKSTSDSASTGEAKTGGARGSW